MARWPEGLGAVSADVAVVVVVVAAAAAGAAPAVEREEVRGGTEFPSSNPP